MTASTLEGTALFLLLGLGACADGLAEAPGGMAVLLGGVALSGVLVRLAHSSAWVKEREATDGPQSSPNPSRSTGGARVCPGKKKAATALATPGRLVKQSDRANISRPYFTGAEGESQDGAKRRTASGSCKAV